MRYILLTFCLVLAACQASAPQRSDSAPANLPAGVDISHFPAGAAGYTRGVARRYTPASYSVGYDSISPQFRNTVTLYFKEESQAFAELFELEKQGIVVSYPGAALLREYPVSLQKAGVSYTGRAAVFELTMNGQKVQSRLMLVQLPTRYFKLRSSAPVEYAQDLEVRNQQLLDAVNWAY